MYKMQMILQFLAIYREAGLIGKFPFNAAKTDSLEKLALIKSLGSLFFCYYVVFCLCVCIINIKNSFWGWQNAQDALIIHSIEGK